MSNEAGEKICNVRSVTVTDRLSGHLKIVCTLTHMVACLGNICQIQMPFYPASILCFASTAIEDVPLL